MIRHESIGWQVYSEDGKRHLGGPYKTLVESVHRLRQVEWFKNQKTPAPTAWGLNGPFGPRAPKARSSRPAGAKRKASLIP